MAVGFCDCDCDLVYIISVHMFPVKGECSGVLSSRLCLTQQLQHFYWSLSYQLRHKHIWYYSQCIL